MLSAAILLSALTTIGNDAEVVDWLKTKAVQLTTVEAGKGLADMAPLATTLKDAQIVGMGESTHGSREIFQMKHRMFEFLVQKLGFRVFGLEASMPDCVAMDTYVLTGKGDPGKALSAQGFWTWNTQEVLSLLKWMRAYNANTKNTEKLRVVGFDMQNQTGAATFLKSKLKNSGKETSALIDALTYGPPVKDKVAKIHSVIDQLSSKIPPEELKLTHQVADVLVQGYGTQVLELLSVHQRSVGPHLQETLQKTTKILEDNPTLEGDAWSGIEFLAKASKSVVPPPPGGAATLRAYADGILKFSAGHKDAELLERCRSLLLYFAFAEENKAYLDGNHRDKCMADNVEWIQKTYLPGRKIMLWAHNYHIANIRQSGKADAMGSHLTERFKESYYPVGFAFLEGSFQARSAGGGALKEWTVSPAVPSTLEAVLAKAGHPIFFADLGGATGSVDAWLRSEIKSRSIGAVYSPDHADLYYFAAKPAELYRGLIYIKKTTRAKPL